MIAMPRSILQRMPDSHGLTCLMRARLEARSVLGAVRDALDVAVAALALDSRACERARLRL
jgi:hypothetical protein